MPIPGWTPRDRSSGCRSSLGIPGGQSTVRSSGRKASGSSGSKDSAPHWVTAWLAGAGRLLSVDISCEGEIGHLCCPLPDLCSMDAQGSGFGAPSLGSLAAVESWV